MTSRNGIILAAVLLVPGLLAAGVAEDAAPGRQEAYRLYSLAQQALLSRDYLHAVEQMEQAAARDDSPTLLLELAQLKYSLDDLDGAAVLAQRVVAADPREAAARQLLGDIHLTRARQGESPEANVGLAVDEYLKILEANPADRDAARSLAELYYQTGRLKETIDVLRAYARTQPLDPTMALLLGKSLLRSGRLDEAEPLLTGVMAKTPANVEAADALAALYEVQKKYDAALSVYADLVRAGAVSAYVQDRIGALDLAAGRPKEAVRALEEGQRLDPKNTRGLLVLAQAYEEAGDPAVARQRYQQAIRQEPGNLEARFRLARLQRQQGDEAAAREGFQSVLDQATGRGAVSEREAAILGLTHSEIGLMAMEARNYSAAAEAFERALDASDEPGPELFLLLGQTRLESGNLDEATRVAAEALRRHPNDLELRVFSGEVQMARGDVAGADAFYRALLKETGGAVETYGRIGEALIRRKRFAPAEAILRDGVRVHPDDETLLFARGAALERLGQLNEAEKLLARVIKANPKNAPALNYLGYMLADRGLKLRESLAYVERAVSIDPKNAAYLDSLGWAQFKLARYAAAEKSLREAMRYDGADPTIREHLGDVLMQAGRPDEAQREWEEALQRSPEDPDKIRRKIAAARKAVQAGR